MKQILFLLAALLGLAACSNPSQTAGITNGVSPAQIQRLNFDYMVGSPRISFAIFDGPEPLVNVDSVSVKAELIGGENGPEVEMVTAVPYTDYEIPYWVITPQLPTPGVWGLTAVITLKNGETINAQFLVEAKSQSDTIPIGAAAPLSQNRTLATEPDLYKLSSGNEPNPAFYQMTIAEAAQTGKPTVVAFATPGLCQTKWCTPVLDSVETLYEEVDDQANFIHVEVYADFQELTLVPQMAEWGLQTEPWVYVLDGDGRVAARFEGPLSPRELRLALEPLLP
ncbi:MAG TPA: thioredoxin family protein [Chloroflexota bacterium]|nr:thioredoxin family protein [Chloroflexota bacterium]